MKIETKDAIVQTVLKKMDERSLIGQKKYGATMMQEIEGQEKDLNRFLVDVQEELNGCSCYTSRLLNVACLMRSKKL